MVNIYINRTFPILADLFLGPPKNEILIECQLGLFVFFCRDLSQVLCDEKKKKLCTHFSLAQCHAQS